MTRKASGHAGRVRRRVLLAFGAAVALSSTACISHDAPADLMPGSTAVEPSAPLGGEALMQRKRDMRRAYGDMIHFYTTLESLHHRRERNGIVQLSKFLDAYLGMHVDPLLAGEWQSRHPELTAIDANVRFAKAELLIQLGQTRRAQGVMNEIERRFQGREDMLVDYPFGDQRSLGEGLEMLRNRKWRG